MCVWHLQHYTESQLNLSFGANGLRIGLLFITHIYLQTIFIYILIIQNMRL